MAQTQTARESWAECPHSSPWRHKNPRPNIRNKRGALGWPEIKRDKKVLAAGEVDANAWKMAKSRPPAETLPANSTATLDDAVRIGKGILQALEEMTKATDAPDFQRRPTDEAYKAARKSLKDAYTHYVGSAPAPAIAPDGDGGVVVQWKSGRLEVSLIVPSGETQKRYIYSRGAKKSQVDYDISGSVLAQQLRTTFVN